MAVFDKRTASVLSTILLFIACGAFIYGASRILIVFLLAIFFAYLLDPFVTRLETWNSVSKGSRSIAIAEVYAILCLAFAMIVLFAGPPIASDGRKMAEALPGLFQKLSSGAIIFQIGSKRGWSYETQIRLQQFLASHSGTILSWVSSAGIWLAATARNAIWIVLIPILAIFFLKDGRAFIENTLEVVRVRQQKRLLAGITGDLNEMLAHYIRSQILLAGLSIAFYIAILSLLRVPYAPALGTVAGVLEFIPLVGPLVGAAAILGVAFLANYHHLLVVALFLGAWRVVQDYFTAPRIMGSKLELHPLTVIFAVLVGGEIGGVIGVYLSIPIAAAVRIVVRRWRRLNAEQHQNIKAA